MTFEEAMEIIKAGRARIVELPRLTPGERKRIAAKVEYQSIKNDSSQVVRALSNAAEEARAGVAVSLDFAQLAARIKHDEQKLDMLILEVLER